MQLLTSSAQRMHQRACLEERFLLFPLIPRTTGKASELVRVLESIRRTQAPINTNQMAYSLVLRAEVHARAVRASQTRIELRLG